MKRVVGNLQKGLLSIIAHKHKYPDHVENMTTSYT